MEALRQELKRLNSRDTSDALKRIGEVLKPDCKKFDEYIIFNNRQKQLEDGKRLGLIKPQDANIESNQIIAGVIYLINNLIEEDLLISKSNDENRKTLHPFHCYTCDRKVHNLKFVKQFKAKKAEKVHFFYLFGEEKQSPHGLFQRFAHHVEGSLLDYRNENVERTSEAIKEEITFELYHDLEVDQQEILSNLFSEMNVPFDTFEPILEKKLDFLYENSPRIQELQNDDFVCILLDISSYNWDAEAVPALIKWFCGEFCQVELPEEAPTFIFFFAIIFEEPDQEVEDEVKEAITDSTYLFTLPQLDKVPIRDIKAWFSAYRFITSTQESRNSLISKFFAEEEFDMEKIERNLEKIINDYNNNLIE